MKIFKRWHIFIIVFSILIIAALFLLVAFANSIENVQRWSLFSTMFFGLASASLSLIALFISIHTFVMSNKQQKERLENEAKNFIVNYSADINFIPLCIVASLYNRHHTYNRSIYKAFNELNNEQQTEVLRQLNYVIKEERKSDWIDNGLEKIRKFINDYDLGPDLLYDNAKYFHKIINYSSNKYNLKLENVPLISSYCLGLPKYEIRSDKEPVDKGLCFDEYVRRYLYAFINNDIRIKLSPKPIDVLREGIDFGSCEESFACFWVVVIVDCFAKLLIEKNNNKNYEPLCFEGKIETYEDRFLLSLLTLYNLELCGGDQK